MSNDIQINELAQVINAEYEAAQTDAQSAVQHAINCGTALVDAKAKCNHGEWLPWLEANVTFSHKTATSYMKLAEANMKRASILDSAKSVREAIKLIDAPYQSDKNSASTKRKPNANGNKPSVDDAKVAELGRAGLSEEAIAESLGTTRRAVVCSFTRQAKEQLRKEGEALPAQCEEAKQELSLTAQQKLDKAIALFEQKKLAEMQQEFQVELAAAVAAKQEKLEALIQSAKEQEHAAKQLRQQLMDARATVDRIMTYEEFKIVRGLLHPDRYPDDLKDRAGKAFDIFNRLEKCVNPNIGVAELRKRGWEHLSPYGRRKSA